MLLIYIYSGQSGSGKSSINALLMRYYDPVKGKVTFDGQGERGILNATGELLKLVTRSL